MQASLIDFLSLEPSKVTLVTFMTAARTCFPGVLIRDGLRAGGVDSFFAEHVAVTFSDKGRYWGQVTKNGYDQRRSHRMDIDEWGICPHNYRLLV